MPKYVPYIIVNMRPEGEPTQNCQTKASYPNGFGGRSASSVVWAMAL